MRKSKIEWCDQTWNPVTGCKHGCEYCYARKIANRFGIQTENTYPVEIYNKLYNPYPFGFSPTFHRYRIEEPQYIKKPQNIFVCSMADLFGEWIPDEWIEKVFEACEKAPQHRYLFLTKNPERYDTVIDIIQKDRGSGECYDRFKRVWFGTTITSQKDLERLKVLSELEEGHRFVSIEPIQESLILPLERKRCPNCGSAEVYEDNPATTPEGTPPCYCDCCGEWEGRAEELEADINWVIIGAETGNRKGKVVPKRGWIENIVEQCKAKNIPVFMKNSLASVWGKPLMQEYPWDNSIKQDGE